jgi:Fe-S-cluster-containing hydrogenase component 2
MVEDGGNGKRRLQINFSNCVHCKTCDIMDPYQIINWLRRKAAAAGLQGHVTRIKRIFFQISADLLSILFQSSAPSGLISNCTRPRITSSSAMRVGLCF